MAGNLQNAKDVAGGFYTQAEVDDFKAQLEAK